VKSTDETSTPLASTRALPSVEDDVKTLAPRRIPRSRRPSIGEFGLASGDEWATASEGGQIESDSDALTEESHGAIWHDPAPSTPNTDALFGEGTQFTSAV
jgi:hypothetical protein